MRLINYIINLYSIQIHADRHTDMNTLINYPAPTFKLVQSISKSIKPIAMVTGAA